MPVVELGCKGDQIEIFIGDQGDRVFLQSLIKKIPRIDILIDDGGHRMKQQINTFEEIFPHINDNGIYLFSAARSSQSSFLSHFLLNSY